MAAMDPRLIVDHFAKAIRKHFKDCTAVELEDKYLPARAFLDTTPFSQDRSLDHLAQYLETFAGGRENLTKPVQRSQPHTLVICPSGIRAADVTRTLRTFRTDESAVAKLFAKHLKLKDTIDYVGKTKFGFGIGTPVRLNDLIAADAMHLHALERIVIDGSYLDEKRRTIFSMKEVFSPMLELLHRPDVSQGYGKEGGIQILVF